jgi:hypothetical protein
MRTTVLSVGVLSLFGAVLSAPASAQMCGSAQQANNAVTTGMMCGPSQRVADDPMADKPVQQPQASGMCPCCRNMAMMRGGSGGMQHNMPGMEMPKQ